MNKPNLPRWESTGELMTYAWPGGYPIFYVCKDASILCPKCANEYENEQTELAKNPDNYMDYEGEITSADINWEDPHLYCDNCSQPIECAYCEDENA